MSGAPEGLAAALSDRYAVREKLGEGGMATVYLADDLKHKRQVAIKVLAPELAAAVGGSRFLREIEIAAGLAHPHILPVHDSGGADGFLYYVMPYVEEESLRDRLERLGPLPAEDAVRIAREIADALDFAHERGVVHRDVKPGNILLEAGHAVLADFGIAQAVAEAGDASLTRTGISLGSPSYMSPEQASGEGELDGRSDQFSLACVVYEMLAGRPPFGGGPARAVLARILTDDATRLEDVRGDLPTGVADAVHRALSPDPEDRFERAADFARALREAVAESGASRGGPGLRLAAGVAAAVVIAVGGWMALADGGSDLEALEAVNAVQEALDASEAVRAYRLAGSLPEAVEDSVRERLLAETTVFDTVRTDPAGARVSWRPLADPDAPWEELGRTPLKGRFPAAPVLLQLELEGYRSRLLWIQAAREDVAWPLRPLDGPLPDALYVPGGTVNPGVLAGGIWQGDAREVGDYLLDRYEVTNREYEEFVDADGYERRELWEHPFVTEGRRIGWEEAMATFVDRTGQPGPSTWEIGTYPDGTADHPVTGLSWYEAAAYARFRGRELPTLYHWVRAAAPWGAQNVVPLSNLDADRLAPVGRYPGVTNVGAFDMAGNAREWTVNAADEYRLTQGGGWSDPVYTFPLAQPLDPMVRSELNGVRLMTNLGSPEVLAVAGAPVAYYDRDFAAETPVSDDVFEVFRDIYAYDDTPLNPVVQATDSVQPGIVRERITFDAAYGGERMVLYLFHPAEESPEPREVVVYFPGSGVLSQTEFGMDAAPRSREALVVRSGRVFAFPIIDGSYERTDEFVYPLQDESNSYRDRVIEWYQDIARTLDYLETRPDIDTDRAAYLGNSLGGRMGAIMLALERRFRTGLLHVAGLSPKPTQPVVDPFNFLPRVEVPVLMLSGQFDPIYPLETSARPFFRGLGSEVKEHYVSEGAHFVPWAEFAREVLDWLDRHLSAAPGDGGRQPEGK